MGAARLVGSVVARAVLFAMLGMLAWGLLPFALGWTPTTVMTGSMEPRISAGDVVVSRPVPAGTASPGHILLVDDPDHAGKLRLHRYVEDAPDGGLILRGDANQSNDSSPVAPDAVHGVAVLRVPFVGLPMVWLAEKNWGNLASVFVAVSALTMAAAAGSSAASSAASRGQSPVKTGPTRGRQPRTGRPAIRRRVGSTARPATRRHLRRTARRAQTTRVLLSLASLPVLVTPGLFMAAPSHAAFSAAAPTQASSFSALSSYPCFSAARPDSPYLFYAFNEVSGAAVDASVIGRNGTLQGTASRVGGSCAADDSPALRLDGSTSYVSTPTRLGSAPNSFTLEIWFKTETTKGGRLLGLGNAQTGASSVTDRQLYMTNTGAINFGVGPVNRDGLSVITSRGGYNDGAWHQATVTMSQSWGYDRSTGGIVLPGITLFIDGQLVDYDLGATSGPTYAGYWRIGYDTMNTSAVTWPGAPTNRSFDGTIDNAAVYSDTLDSAQIRAHQAAGR